MVPRLIRVGPYRMQVVISDEMCDRATHLDGENVEAVAGNFPGEGKIALRPGLAPDFQADSLLHEVLHMCIRLSGRWCLPYEQEEEYVSAITSNLLGVLRDNPKFVEYLLHPEGVRRGRSA